MENVNSFVFALAWAVDFVVAFPFFVGLLGVSVTENVTAKPADIGAGDTERELLEAWDIVDVNGRTTRRRMGKWRVF